jgi:hypothetical protein
MATSRAELEKLTTPKLRELALAQFPNLTGVSGMKKEELVDAIIAEEVRQGLRPKEDAKAQATATMGTGQLKSAIRAMKTARAAALETRDYTKLQATRLQMKRMKRRLRKLREAS